MRSQINIGDVFGNFTVIREEAQVGNTRKFLFKCICGVEKVLSLGLVKGLFTKSCGCMKVSPKLTTTHGMTNTRLYRTWCDMKKRCYNPNAAGYENYGGRGIRVCEEWQTFEPFMKWANENGYTPVLTIERKENDKWYMPSNCEWIPKCDQNKNKRNVVMITHLGETKSMAEWCRILNIPLSRIIARKEYGWDLSKALSVPVNPKKRKVNYAS